MARSALLAGLALTLVGCAGSIDVPAEVDQVSFAADVCAPETDLLFADLPENLRREWVGYIARNLLYGQRRDQEPCLSELIEIDAIERVPADEIDRDERWGLPTLADHPEANEWVRARIDEG